MTVLEPARYVAWPKAALRILLERNPSMAVVLNADRLIRWATVRSTMRGIAGGERFREGDRWFIVDYKSDSTTGRLDALVQHYERQVEHYGRFWSRLTGAPTGAGLFFVDGCIERWVT